jgi:hypothetical protein
MGLGLAFENQPQASERAELLAAGTYTVEQIALRRRQAAGVPPAETLAVLDRLFLGGFFDEEPAVPESPVPESPVPESPVPESPVSESPVSESTAPEPTRVLQLTATGRPTE